MCGIIAYIGEKDVVPIIIEGLKSLEYRGYDSAGLAVLQDGEIQLRKCEGKIVDLEELLKTNGAHGVVGIGHTRWATHGKPSQVNAHPHLDCTGKIAIVHNGIIENYRELKEELINEGHTFKSETDTEVLAHLVEKYYEGDLETAVRKAVKRVEGSYAIAVICVDDPERIVGARCGSPLVVGFGKGENFLASDIPAILSHTRDIVHLDDEECVVITKDGVRITDLEGKVIEKAVMRITWDAEMAQKGGFPHFMLKEIFEQPRAIRDTFGGRVDLETGQINLPELGMSDEELLAVKRIVITACGTSYHAGLVGEYMIEGLARLPVEVDNAAEFRYRDPVIDEDVLVIAISQSGETADTIGAVREAKARGARVICICNVVGSSITRESDGVIYTHAGPEIGVASTKAFTTQLTVLFLMAVMLGRLRGTLPEERARELLGELQFIPGKVEFLLDKDETIQKIADKYYRVSNCLYLGRGEGYPIALEGALKMKEISYIHAEGYPAAEMKHGPIALIDENMPVVVIALRGRRYEKILGNIEEVKARGGRVIALATEGDEDIVAKVDEVLYIPDTVPELSGILAVVPLQLLAYHVAVRRGCHVDQPRNLAKSVTVE